MGRTLGHFSMAPQMCPACGYFCDTASPIGRHDGKPPVPNDMTLCLQCGTALVFGPRLEFHRANSADLATFEHQQPNAYALLRRGQRAIQDLPWKPPALPMRGGRA